MDEKNVDARSIPQGRLWEEWERLAALGGIERVEAIVRAYDEAKVAGTMDDGFGLWIDDVCLAEHTDGPLPDIRSVRIVPEVDAAIDSGRAE